MKVILTQVELDEILRRVSNISTKDIFIRSALGIIAEVNNSNYIIEISTEILDHNLGNIMASLETYEDPAKSARECIDALTSITKVATSFNYLLSEIMYINTTNFQDITEKAIKIIRERY